MLWNLILVMATQNTVNPLKCHGVVYFKMVRWWTVGYVYLTKNFKNRTERERERGREREREKHYVQRLSSLRERAQSLPGTESWLVWLSGRAWMKCEQMAGTMRGQERHRSREPGWDKNIWGMETIFDFGISLKRNGKPLKFMGSGGGITRYTFLRGNHISN